MGLPHCTRLPQGMVLRSNKDCLPESTTSSLSGEAVIGTFVPFTW